MPDADDFDVEYFRNLLQGNRPKARPLPAAEPPLSVAKKTGRQSAKPAAARGKSAPAVAPRKGKNR